MGARAFLKNRPIIEVVFWTLLFIGEMVPDMTYTTPLVAFFGAIIYMLPLIGAVHLWYALYTGIRKKKYSWGLLTISGIILILAAPSITYLVHNACFPDYAIMRSLTMYVLVRAPIAITIIGGVILLLFTLDSWVEEVTAQANLKSEKLLSELRALKSQINPHFLFNTLNNIYFYACSEHPNTPVMIEKLSHILRYLVYEGEKEQVSLKQEIEILEDLIDLYKIKNTEQKNISLEQVDILQHHQIAPLLLVNLLENAFKHSDALANPEGFIHVKAEVKENRLYFHVSNSMKQEISNSESNGVGQLNIQTQLDLIYQEDYSLQTQVEDRVYHLDLSLPIFQSTEYAVPDAHR